MRLLRAAAAAVLVLGCASTAPSPLGSPLVDLPLGRPDAVLKARVLESINAAAAMSPQPDWYRHLHMLGGLPDVAVEGGVLFVIAELPDTDSGRTTAQTVCVGLSGSLALEGLGDVTLSHVAVTNLSNVTLAECLPEEARAGSPP